MSRPFEAVKLIAKRILYPGLDLHTRCRNRHLPDFIRGGALDTLDAGFGNGALALVAWKKGNRVLGVSFLEREVSGTRRFFDSLGIARDSIDLRHMNIYDLRSLGRRFDQIICSETLEHIRGDDEVIRIFSELLRPGGRLLLCCPHSLHPEHNLGRTDEPETGYHVRDGYTLESYRALLDQSDLRIKKVLGLGSWLVCKLDKILREIRCRVGDVGGLPFFLVFLPLTWLDRPNPKVPFSLAIVAEKPDVEHGD